MKDIFVQMKRCTFANLYLYVFCWSKLANPYIYILLFSTEGAKCLKHTNQKDAHELWQMHKQPKNTDSNKHQNTRRQAPKTK